MVKSLCKVLKPTSEIAFINEYLIGYILNEKFNMSREEINRLITKAKEEHKKAIEEIEKIERMLNLNAPP